MYRRCWGFSDEAGLKASTTSGPALRQGSTTSGPALRQGSIEGTYAADSEARLRHDFETQGLHVLSLRQRSALAGIALVPKRRKISHQQFLVFNQAFATLLKAGTNVLKLIVPKGPVNNGVIYDYLRLELDETAPASPKAD